jgi:hypothetical protein
LKGAWGKLLDEPLAVRFPPRPFQELFETKNGIEGKLLDEPLAVKRLRFGLLKAPFKNL